MALLMGADQFFNLAVRKVIFVRKENHGRERCAKDARKERERCAKGEAKVFFCELSQFFLRGLKNAHWVIWVRYLAQLGLNTL